MSKKTRIEGRESAYRTALSVLLISGTLATALAKPGVSSHHPSDETLVFESSSSTTPNCGGSFWVGTTARTISIPRAVNNTPVFCQWLLKANDKHSTIALSAIHTTLDFAAPKVSFRLEARDGWLSDSPLIGAFELNPEGGITRSDFSLYHPVKATSGFMLIRFWNEGYDPIQTDLAYYTCGGQIDSSGRISSPIFNDLSLLPGIVECDWRLRKPETSLYGYLRPVFLNIADCCFLQLRGNSSMRVLENIALSSDQSDNMTTGLPSNFTVEENLVTFSGGEDILCQAAPSGPNVVPICGDSIRLVAFESEFAILNYFSLNPVKEIGFKAMYGSFKVPNPLEAPSKVTAWYLNYCALIIFTPIGTLLGAIIIFYQTRRRWPERSNLLLSTRMVIHKDAESYRERVSSFHSARGPCDSFRVSTATNIAPLSTKLQRQHSGGMNNDDVARKALLKTSEKKRLSNLDDSSMNTPNTEFPQMKSDTALSSVPGGEAGKFLTESAVDVLADTDVQTDCEMKVVRFGPKTLSKGPETG